MGRGRVLWIATTVVLIGLLCSTKADAPAQETLAAESLSASAEQEQIFAYHVLADAVRRSVEALRYIDAMLVALLAAQSTILAIFVERPGFAGAPLDWALIVAIIGLGLTAFARDGPNADDFALRFPMSPIDTRASLIDRFERIASWNGGLHALKSVLLVGCLGTTLWGVLAATAFLPVLFGGAR